MGIVFYEAIVEVKEFEELDSTDAGRSAKIIGTTHNGFIKDASFGRLHLQAGDRMIPFTINDQIIFLDNMEIRQ